MTSDKVKPAGGPGSPVEYLTGGAEVVEPVGEMAIERAATLADQVYENIARALLYGVWGPGERLPVRQFAQEMLISTTPVRDAMMRLANEGALTNPDGRGFWTVRLNKTDFKEMLNIRIALEGMAGEAATALMSRADIDRLEDLNESLRSAIAQDRFAAAQQVDTQFHLAFYEHAGMPLLNSMVMSMLRRGGPTRSRLQASYRKSLVGHTHHGRIIAALRARDAATVMAELRADLTDGANSIMTQLED